MEDDVINNLENMKLTTDEEEVISISNEGPGSRDWKLFAEFDWEASHVSIFQ